MVWKEVHYYNPSVSFYPFDNDGTEYEVILVEGYKSDRKHTFIKDTDYEVINNGIRWLPGGDRPELPPTAILATGNIPFEVSYVYEATPEYAMKHSIHPFIKDDGMFMTIVRSFASQIMHLFSVKNGVVKDHDITKAYGDALDHLASWFNVTRFSGESDDSLRGRLLEFLNSYVSSGTIDSVKAAVEAYTGVEPDIVELWQNISYFDYNIDDYNNQLSPDQWRTYLFDGGEPDNVYTFDAYFYDILFKENTFFCILDDDTLSSYDLSDIKNVLNASKAAGVQAYIGWLVNETFADAKIGTTESEVDWVVIAP